MVKGEVFIIDMRERTARNICKSPEQWRRGGRGGRRGKVQERRGKGKREIETGGTESKSKHT